MKETRYEQITLNAANRAAGWIERPDDWIECSIRRPWPNGKEWRTSVLVRIIHVDESGTAVALLHARRPHGIERMIMLPSPFQMAYAQSVLELMEVMG